MERSREEAYLAAEVNVLHLMVEGQREHDREQWLEEELRLQDAHVEVDRLALAEVDRLRKEQETPQKLKGKNKKKKPPSRSLRDERRAEEHRAKAEELVARLEAERVERAGEEEDDDEKTDWRIVAQDDLNDSELELGSLNYPRQHAGAGLPQDLREVPKDEAVEALRSLVRAAAGPELKFRAGVETTAGELAAATTSGAGLAKKQSKVFDPGGGL